MKGRHWSFLETLCWGMWQENLREVDSTADEEPGLVSGNVSQEPCHLLDLVSSVGRHMDIEQWPGLAQCGSCPVEAQSKAECPSAPHPSRCWDSHWGSQGVGDQRGGRQGRGADFDTRI